MNPVESDGRSEVRKKVLDGARWVVGVRILNQVINWIATIAVVRLLTPRDYGLNAMLEVVTEIALILGTMSLDSAIIRFGVRNRDKIAAAFGLLLVLNFSLFALIFISSESIAAYFGEPSLSNLIRVVSVILLVAPFRVIPNAILDMNLDFKLKANVDFVASILSSITSLALAWLGYGVWALVIAVVIGALVRAFALMALRPWIVVPSLRFGAIADVVRYGSVLALGGAIGIVSAKVLNAVAGPVIGAEELGLYAVALVFAILPMSKVMPVVQQTIFPVIAAIREDHLEARRYILKALDLSAFVIVPASVGIVILAGLIVEVVFGSSWAGLALPLAVLSSFVPLRLLNQIFHAPLNAVGLAQRVNWVHLLNAVVLVAGSFHAVQYGVIGLVWLNCAAVVLSTILSLSLAWKVFSLTWSDIFRAVLPALTCSALMGFVLYLVVQWFPTTRPALTLSGAVVAGVFLYLGSMRLCFRTRFTEILNYVLGRRPLNPDA